jgi:UDP-N-acetylmuramoylalanine--D-glutamate ligase
MLLELTSSHLAFCTTSPDVAVVTCFWPDHVELHGSVAAYRAAKERIVRHQAPGDRVVYDVDDVRVSGFADLTPATRFPFSLQHPVERGAFLRGSNAVVRLDDVEAVVGPVPLVAGGRARAALAALAAALAVGVEPERLVGSLAALGELPHRARVVGELDGTSLVDDSAAATGAKAAATLLEYPEGSLVAVVGGALESVGLTVQASPEERRLLEDALDVLARTARLVVVFGSAGGSLVGPLHARSVPVVEVGTLEEAVLLGLERSPGASALVVSPMFPLAQEDRALVERLLVSAR